MGSAKVCVIGAGPSGVAAAKNLLEAGIDDVTVFDRNDQVGGNWIYDPDPGHSSVYDTTHIISSKTLSQFDDYPMPKHFPDYPGHRQLLDYFQSYARHFDVERHIRFGTTVEKAERTDDGTWRITTDGGESTDYDHLLVANGHHWDPRLPDYPGQFTGEFLHAHFYKRAEPYRGKRVLVIGGGNSACDIAVETSRVSAATHISMRRGYYFIPKFLFGVPTDVFNLRNAWLPRPLARMIFKRMLIVLQGRNRDYGLEEPDHELMTVHPTLNSELLYGVRHGRVTPRRDIARFDGSTVHFTDGSADDFDTVIAATGYHITFPFLDKTIADFSGLEVPLYLKVFHPEYDNLFFIGLCQPLGCIWPLSDYQSRLVAQAIKGNWPRPDDIQQRIRRELDHPDAAWMKVPRHALEVDFHAYRGRLKKELAGQHAF